MVHYNCTEVTGKRNSRKLHKASLRDLGTLRRQQKLVLHPAPPEAGTAQKLLSILARNLSRHTRKTWGLLQLFTKRVVLLKGLQRFSN